MKYIFAGVTIGLLTLASGTWKAVASSEVGLHIEFSEIKDTFTRHLVKYIGECPGESRSGIAENGDLRFISKTTEPNKKLEVNLINTRTGKKIRRDYKKLGRGSNDFNLTQLGNNAGSHGVEYAIFDKDTKEILETGSFTYNVELSEETKERNANWKLELYCASDSDKKLNECNTIGSREVKYCQGSKTGDVRDRGIVNLDRKTVEIDLDIN